MQLLIRATLLNTSFCVLRVDDRFFSNGAIGPVATAMHETYWQWIHDPAYRTEIEYDAKSSA